MSKSSPYSCCRNFLKKSNQFISNHKSLSVFVLVLLLFAGIGYATTINENGISNTPSLNNISYVESGNANDIQSKISSANSGDTIIIPSGIYSLTNQINLTSNITIINYGILQWATGATPPIHLDNQSDSFNFIFYGLNIKQLTFLNYGEISPRRIYNPTGIENNFFILNGTNIDIFGGRVSNSNNAYKLINSWNSSISNLVTNEGGGVGSECSTNLNINNIVGYGVSEAVDLNYGDNFVNIGNINYNKNNQSEEIIDINRGRNIAANNIIGRNAARLLRSNDNNGTYNPRWGDCNVQNETMRQNVSITGGICINCSSPTDLDNGMGIMYNQESIYFQLSPTPASSTNAFEFIADDGGSTANADLKYTSSGDLIFRVRSRSDGDTTSLLFQDDDGIKLQVAESGQTQIGWSGVPANITMFSPDGTSWNCGVNNSGSFLCS